MADGLLAAGHDAVHVRAYDLAAAEDHMIFNRAAAERRVVLSADTDFGTLLALRREVQPSVVVFRGAVSRRPALQIALLLSNLPSIGDALSAGAVVVIEPARIRVRALPIAR